jgi:hypothetical protein
MTRQVVKEAQELEDLYYSHMRSLLRIFRGEEPVREGEAF